MALHLTLTPSTFRDEFSKLQQPSHALIDSNFVLRLFVAFPVGLPSCGWMTTADIYKRQSRGEMMTFHLRHAVSLCLHSLMHIILPHF